MRRDCLEHHNSALRQLATRLGLRNVRFVGPVPPDEIWRYYADADIYVQTPEIDNMPASVLEAFASGCAVVSTDAGGVPAILTNGVHGLLVARGDHEAAAARIISLLDNPEFAERLTVQARESCDRYSWPAVRPLWLSVYHKVMQSTRTLEASAAHDSRG